MPKALGEFGKSRNSDMSHRIMQLLGSTDKIVTLKDLWGAVHSDMEKVSDLCDLMRNLVMAEKVITVEGGFLERRAVREEQSSDVIDWSILTAEERNMK
jgi:hypothetical protein